MAEKILIIDDDILNLKLATHILQSEYEVLCAKSGNEGIAILHNEEIDLVVLDLMMPDMNGLEILAKIREDITISDVKVIIFTAYGMKSDVIEAVRLGALDFIKKPFMPAELLERINKVIQIEKKDSILVIDDDRMSLMVAYKMLEIQYDVVGVLSGSEALSYLEKNTPNMILLDYQLSDLDSMEIMDRIQCTENLADTPVIFLTEDEDRTSEAELLKSGAWDVIHKPFITETVIRRISRIMELYHYQNSLKHEVDKKTAELRESNRRITNLSVQVMLALASAIDAKDTYTNGHSMRVAEYSREIARRLGKSNRELNDIYYIGLLHDIGKIGIPDTIINKPGRLTNDEYELVKNHPKIGADILENISEIPSISKGAHWHHEKYNGTGYPDGLVADEIPEVARIIAVADAYDTMTSKRSYRDVLPQAIVRNEIAMGKGTQFDPVIADIMLEMIDEDTEYSMQEKII